MNDPLKVRVSRPLTAPANGSAVRGTRSRRVGGWVSGRKMAVQARLRVEGSQLRLCDTHRAGKPRFVEGSIVRIYMENFL